MEMADSESSDDASGKYQKIKEKIEGITAETGNWKT